MVQVLEASSHTIQEIRQRQRDFFRSGQTLDIAFRKRQLMGLRDSIREHEEELLRALEQDLGKSEFEAFSNEIGLVYSEIRHALKNLKRWSKARKIGIELYLRPGTGRIFPEPYGSALIIGPWNYPMQLLFLPAVGAIAAGNCIVLKPSELASHTAEVSRKIIESAFPPEYGAIVQGGPEVSRELIDQNFDYLFFTGSVGVGKKVMEAASVHLTPLTLELGGKSPAIVHRSADIELAARKIAFAKYNNAGQTCVAPDYVLVDAEVERPFLEALDRTITEFYGARPRNSSAYGRIINMKNFNRLETLMNKTEGNLFHGGERDSEELYIEPSVYRNISWDDPLMEDELFGPILPVISYTSLEESIRRVADGPKPLAAYIFARDRKAASSISRAFPFGGGGVNSALLHVASHKLPFGGVGSSGMGRYHGKASFDSFSHYKSMLHQPSSFDMKLAYPHKKLSMSMVRKIFS